MVENMNKLFEKELLDELNNGDTTLVIRCDEKVIKSNHKGISPLIELNEKNLNLEGACAYDKIVGKAAALLYARLNIKYVYAEVLSKRGMDTLDNYGVEYDYSVFTDEIINRLKTGMCPMEETVLDVNNPEEAYEKLKKKIIEMKNNK